MGISFCGSGWYQVFWKVPDQVVPKLFKATFGKSSKSINTEREPALGKVGYKLRQQSESLICYVYNFVEFCQIVEPKLDLKGPPLDLDFNTINGICLFIFLHIPADGTVFFRILLQTRQTEHMGTG